MEWNDWSADRKINSNRQKVHGNKFLSRKQRNRVLTWSEMGTKWLVQGFYDHWSDSLKIFLEISWCSCSSSCWPSLSLWFPAKLMHEVGDYGIESTSRHRFQSHYVNIVSVGVLSCADLKIGPSFSRWFWVRITIHCQVLFLFSREIPHLSSAIIN